MEEKASPKGASGLFILVAEPHRIGRLLRGTNSIFVPIAKSDDSYALGGLLG